MKKVSIIFFTVIGFSLPLFAGAWPNPAFDFDMNIFKEAAAKKNIIELQNAKITAGLSYVDQYFKIYEEENHINDLYSPSHRIKERLIFLVTQEMDMVTLVPQSKEQMIKIFRDIIEADLKEFEGSGDLHAAQLQIKKDQLLSKLWQELEDYRKGDPLILSRISQLEELAAKRAWSENEISPDDERLSAFLASFKVYKYAIFGAIGFAILGMAFTYLGYRRIKI